MANQFHNAENFKITAGSATIGKYADAETDAGDMVVRHFCKNCGSPVFITNAKIEGKVIVPSGTIDGIAQHDWQPIQEFFCRQRLGFVLLIETSKDRMF